MVNSVPYRYNDDDVFPGGGKKKKRERRGPFLLRLPYPGDRGGGGDREALSCLLRVHGVLSEVDPLYVFCLSFPDVNRNFAKSRKNDKEGIHRFPRQKKNL